MKHSLVALMLMAAAGAASAGGSIGLEQEHFNSRGSGDYVNGTAIYGSYALKHFTLDGRYQFGRTNLNTSFNTAEIGIKKDFKLNDSFTLGLRAGTGRMYPQGESSIPYFVLDPTVTYGYNDRLFLTAGFRVRNNYDGGLQTISPMTWADYMLTDKDILTLGYTAIRGALKADSVTLSITRLF